ncbi:hypothetical protein B0I72DRAFT_132304 [Yarrowia lipolytica]|jgi:pterin-4a-carbinolamine dehydratase|uniref:4a-hydroxytetrahydrobiopterin dehydratase n=2 Tax=Yarrowia lipolytica TaxID=4952 RepID=Q6C118_YARLI|nr:YALI0F19998p [Yarrowia lipolytica CLIB122]AOW07450.1 hypothetical protein YALI1_F26620g [Yarrowia lipolytica]KAB8286508.1 hypothetical protein BKA91DRAFT_131776 [Yarrowia lipolytica]KAE8173548.1 hypothetical protein BKA90DRAFT_135557 [Yarrowia lipolytica]KAJ8055475.1 hypothetical protein LXG23DRAFT_19670 [Yarrowia lipolytica]QNP99802.1 Hypothetical protein YALI2_E01118g [Yarrowia lipolytica]|eukprot:XP_505644.2 YALI0F19998p [Yarrowia lipolytica CLIB122]
MLPLKLTASHLPTNPVSFITRSAALKLVQLTDDKAEIFKPLSPPDQAAYLAYLTSWKATKTDGSACDPESATKLSMDVKFKNYKQTTQFITDVMAISQPLRHHVWFENHYTTTKVVLQTGYLDKLTAIDFRMAELIQLYRHAAEQS